MSKAAWNLIMASKQFNVSLYRTLGKLIIFSLILNLLLVLGLLNTYHNLGESSFYASNGTTPPLLLKAETGPNNSSVPLLASDPPEVEGVKLIPN